MFTVNSSINATIKKPSLIELNMTVPWDTDTYYELGVATTVVGGLPQLKLCRVDVNYAGLNIPCHDPGDQLYITTTSVDTYDQLVWDLGRILNAAIRSALDLRETIRTSVTGSERSPDKVLTTRMRANAQSDGRPAEHRWRPLFNAAKFG